jgi:hypothetical protein
MKTKIFKIKKDWVQETVKNLEDQLVQAILEMGDDAHASFSLSPYSMGYLFGFCSGGFEFHHIDRDLEKVRILIQVYSQLFGDAGHDILQTTLNLNSEKNDLFKEGTASGREESLRWFHRKENPIGLLRYVLNGEKTKSLNPQTPSQHWSRPSLCLAG